MDVSNSGIGKISVCTGFMDSVPIDDTEIDVPRHRIERRNVMKDQNQNQNQNKNNNSNKYDSNQNRNENRKENNKNQSSNKIDKSRNS